MEGRIYIFMTDNQFMPIQEDFNDYLIGSEFSVEEARKRVVNHSRLAHSTGFYQITTAGGEINDCFATRG